MTTDPWEYRHNSCRGETLVDNKQKFASTNSAKYTTTYKKLHNTHKNIEHTSTPQYTRNYVTHNTQETTKYTTHKKLHHYAEQTTLQHTRTTHYTIHNKLHHNTQQTALQHTT
jgi:hypothetical protein